MKLPRSKRTRAACYMGRPGDSYRGRGFARLRGLRGSYGPRVPWRSVPRLRRTSLVRRPPRRPFVSRVESDGGAAARRGVRPPALSHARLASRPRERTRTFSAVTASAVLRSDGPRGPAVVTTGDRLSARFRVTRCPVVFRLGLARVCRARARLSRPTRLETRTKERSRPASRRDSANPTRRNESEPPAVSAGG